MVGVGVVATVGGVTVGGEDAVRLGSGLGSTVSETGKPPVALGTGVSEVGTKDGTAVGADVWVSVAAWVAEAGGGPCPAANVRVDVGGKVGNIKVPSSAGVGVSSRAATIASTSWSC